MPNGTNQKAPPALPWQALLESRLAYHFRCLREDATDMTLSRLERLALVRDRATRIWEIRQTLEQRRRPS
jgi:tryptophan 2,3-dioxygenase